MTFMGGGKKRVWEVNNNEGKESGRVRDKRGNNWKGPVNRNVSRNRNGNWNASRNGNGSWNMNRNVGVKGKEYSNRNVEGQFDGRCRFCQRYGHSERNCRQKNGSCFACGRMGHRAFECKSAGSECRGCKKYGHVERLCPMRGNGRQEQVSNDRGRSEGARDHGRLEESGRIEQGSDRRDGPTLRTQGNGEV